MHDLSTNWTKHTKLPVVLDTFVVVDTCIQTYTRCLCLDVEIRAEIVIKISIRAGKVIITIIADKFSETR